MEQPPAFEQYGPHGEETVLGTIKSVHLLLQSPHYCDKEMDAWLQQYRLRPTLSDPRLYIMRDSRAAFLAIPNSA